MLIHQALRVLWLATALVSAVAAPTRLQESETASEIISRCDAGLVDVLQFVRSKPELFQTNREGLLTIEEKREIWNTWKRFLEYELALESVARSHSNYYD